MLFIIPALVSIGSSLLFNSVTDWMQVVGALFFAVAGFFVGWVIRESKAKHERYLEERDRLMSEIDKVRRTK